MILSKNFSNLSEVLPDNSKNTSDENQMDITDGINLNNNISNTRENINLFTAEDNKQFEKTCQNPNTLQCFFTSLNKLCHQVKILSQVINAIEALGNTHYKRKLNMDKRLKLYHTKQWDFNIFNFIPQLNQIYFISFLEDLNGFIHNILFNFIIDQKTIHRADFFKNLISVVNANKNHKDNEKNRILIESFLSIYESHVYNKEEFDYEGFYRSGLLPLFIYIISEYRIFSSDYLEMVLLVLQDCLKYFSINFRDIYRNIMIDLEKNEINLRLEAMAVLDLTRKINKICEQILDQNWGDHAENRIR